MTLRPILFILALGVLIPLQMGASCASDDGGYRGDGGYHDDDRYDRPNRIPRWADKVRDGKGKLKWDADLDGTIYVYDVDKDYIAYTGPVRRGQEVVIHPEEDRVYVAERVVYRDNLRRDGFYALYFAREGSEHGGRPDNNNPGGSYSDLPRSADRMARGRGDISINEAPRNGRVYVYDEDERRVLYSCDISRGNSFQIFPDRGYVNLNSRRQADVRFRRGNTYGLYFSSSR